MACRRRNEILKLLSINKKTECKCTLFFIYFSITTSNENLTAAESRIRDVDVAEEMMNLSKLNLINQAAQAMMSQAKSQPEGVMQLLR